MQSLSARKECSRNEEETRAVVLSEVGEKNRESARKPMAVARKSQSGDYNPFNKTHSKDGFRQSKYRSDFTCVVRFEGSTEG